jgi:hypothetical protein
MSIVDHADECLNNIGWIILEGDIVMMTLDDD